MKIKKYKEVVIEAVVSEEDVTLNIKNGSEYERITIRNKRSCKSTKPWSHLVVGDKVNIIIKVFKTKEVYVIEYPKETIEITKTKTLPSKRFLNKKATYKCSQSTVGIILDWLSYETDLVWESGEPLLSKQNITDCISSRKPVYLFITEEGKLKLSGECPDNKYVFTLNKKSLVNKLR